MTDTHQAERHCVVNICFSLNKTRTACRGQCRDVSHYQNVPSPLNKKAKADYTS